MAGLFSGGKVRGREMIADHLMKLMGIKKPRTNEHEEKGLITHEETT